MDSCSTNATTRGPVWRAEREPEARRSVGWRSEPGPSNSSTTPVMENPPRLPAGAKPWIRPGVPENISARGDAGVSFANILVY